MIKILNADDIVIGKIWFCFRDIFNNLPLITNECELNKNEFLLLINDVKNQYIKKNNYKIEWINWIDIEIQKLF